jgi:hypothetical protein
MAEEKPLTKSGLVSALKEVGVATKDDVRQVLGEEIESRRLATRDDVRQIVSEEISSRGLATKEDVQQIVSDELHSQMSEFFVGRIKPEIDGLIKEVRQGFKLVNTHIDKLEIEARGIKDDVEGLEADLSDTPSRREFNELKTRIDKYHPLS